MIVGGTSVMVGLGVKYLMGGKGEEGAQTTHKGKGKCAWVREMHAYVGVCMCLCGCGHVCMVACVHWLHVCLPPPPFPLNFKGEGQGAAPRACDDGGSGHDKNKAKVRRHVQALVVDPDMTIKAEHRAGVRGRATRWHAAQGDTLACGAEQRGGSLGRAARQPSGQGSALGRAARWRTGQGSALARRAGGA
ncbi:unnamed protein product [Closterium sp. NIES-64]|nr:unnamed protein product [Closterium sp. NIES-64]